MFKIKLLAFLSVLLLIPVICSADELHFKHYNNKQGLSHNTVFCALQDSRGFMWFGTDEGLNRFDGHTFKTYRHNSADSQSLPNNKIINLSEDSENRLWVCTDTKTCYYNYKDDTFHPIDLPIENAENSRFFSVKEDLQRNLWFTNYDRIVKYATKDKKVTIFRQQDHFQPTHVCTTDKGGIIFSSPDHVYIYKEASNSFTPFRIIEEDERAQQTEISSICHTTGPDILIGTNNAGLKLFNTTTQTIQTIVPDIQVRDIHPYNSNEYWIASESGVFIWNRNNQSVTNLKKSLTNEYSIADNAVYCLVKDKEGGMWAGSFFRGVSYLPKEYTRFNLFIGGRTHPGMLGNAVREICPDRYGNLWLGTEDNGINKYNPQTGEMTNFSLNNPTHPLSATNIHGLLADGNNLWVGTFNNGIDILDITSGKIIKRYTRESTRNGLITNFVLCFCKTSKGDMLIGTADGVLIYNPQTNNFSSWNNIRSLIRQIYEDKAGNIWIVSTSGLYYQNVTTQQLTHFRSHPDNTKSLSTNDITSVFEDSEKRIWITTSHGLNLLNPTNGTTEKITIENGLPSNLLYRIVEDDAKNFWISTANGLVRFNPNTRAIRIFTHTDGLNETQFNFCSSYKSASGLIYMGTTNGLISFNPGMFKDDTFTPPVYITNIRLPKNKGGKQEQIINKPMDATETIKLPYHLSTFTLSYVALSYTSPDAIQYAYMLDGVDKSWIPMNQNNDVTFAGLSPGKYIFNVKSTNSSGIWQDNGKALTIIITPPFWATGWAYGVYVIVLLTGIWLIYNYKKTKLEEKHRISKEMFENEKEKELYNAKIQFFTFITHEIRTPLTLIKAPLEKIIRSEDGTTETRENLKTIEKNTLRLLNLSNQLLDFRKSESKGFKLNFVKTDINRLLTETIHRFIPSITAANKLFTQQLPNEHLICFADREALTKIISNLLTNAVKYSDKQIALKLHLSETDNTFSISVTNDGLLIPKDEKEKIFEPFYRLKETENIQGSGMGLSLARSLTEFHNGTLVYQNTANGLNRFTLTIPQKQAGSYNEIGEETTVTELIPEAETRYPTNTHSNCSTLLIVEDQHDMRHYISKELSGIYNVLEARNGKEAIEVLKQNTVHIIISDVMMPVMDGFEFCNYVKNNLNYSHIPFIILTAQYNLQSRLEGLNNGADAYIEKPFSIDLLTAQTDNLLKSREQLNKAFLEKPLTSVLTLAASKVDDLFLEKLNAYLEKNITNEQLNVEMLAEAMGLSTSSLYRKVKGISGLSPIDFIKVTRLKKAVCIIQQGESRINEIAFQVGFTSPSYFSTCFLKQYGMSPSEFAKSNAAK